MDASALRVLKRRSHADNDRHRQADPQGVHRVRLLAVPLTLDTLRIHAELG
jgi:hypothetical protein